MSSSGKISVLEKAYVTFLVVSPGGNLLDDSVAYPMDENPENIRKKIMDEIVETLVVDDNDKDIGYSYEDKLQEWKEKVEALDLSGDSLTSPCGDSIEVYRRTCMEILASHDALPKF